jgi:hypothetical protein
MALDDKKEAGFGPPFLLLGLVKGEGFRVVCVVYGGSEPRLPNAALCSKVCFGTGRAIALTISTRNLH